VVWGARLAVIAVVGLVADIGSDVGRLIIKRVLQGYYEGCVERILWHGHSCRCFASLKKDAFRTGKSACATRVTKDQPLTN